MGECIALRPTENEAQTIWEAVRECGLEESGEGVLQLLMALIEGEAEPEERSNPILKHFKDHPEDLNMVKNVVTQGLGSLLQKIRK